MRLPFLSPYATFITNTSLEQLLNLEWPSKRRSSAFVTRCVLLTPIALTPTALNVQGFVRIRAMMAMLPPRWFRTIITHYVNIFTYSELDGSK